MKDIRIVVVWCEVWYKMNVRLVFDYKSVFIDCFNVKSCKIKDKLIKKKCMMNLWYLDYILSNWGMILYSKLKVR